MLGGGIKDEDDLVNEYSSLITVVDNTELSQVYTVLVVKSCPKKINLLWF